MKRNFKKLQLFLLVVILLFVQAVPALAIDEDNKEQIVLYEKKEINDLKEIKDRINDKVTDDQTFKLHKENIKIKKVKGESSKDSELEIRNIGSTAQKIKVVKLPDGKTKESYVGTSIIEIDWENENPSDELGQEEKGNLLSAIILKLLQKSSGASYALESSDEDLDDSAAVVIRATVYYDKVGDYYDVLKGKTSITSHQDKTIKITYLQNIVGSGTKACTSSGSYITLANPRYSNSATSTTSFTTGNYVNANDGKNYWFKVGTVGEYIGSYAKATLKRGTSSVWTVDAQVTCGNFVSWSPSGR